MEQLVIKVGGGWFQKWSHGQAIIAPHKIDACVFTDLREAESVEMELGKQGWQPLIQNKNDEKKIVTINDDIKFHDASIDIAYTDNMKRDLSIIIADCIVENKKIARNKETTVGAELVDSIKILNETITKIERLFGVLK